MADYEHVRIERTDAVGRLVMDRPERNNAMDIQMAGEIRDAAIELVEAERLRCLILTGTAGSFNTGADLTTLEGDSTDGERLRAIAGRLHAAVSELARAPVPVITGVNGVAAGGGIGPALCGDIVVLAESARFEFAYPRIGLSVDGGSSYFLPRLVGLRQAQAIAFQDDPVPADRAVELGLATESVPDAEFDDRLGEVADRFAAGPTQAYAVTSRLLRESFERGLDEQMAVEADEIASLARTDDFARGLAAFSAKEEADFEGR